MEEKSGALMEELKAYAGSKGISLNPDKRFVDAVISGIIKNEERHGRRFCPCRPVTGTEEDNKIVCPCAYHMDEIEKGGKCHCGLFVR